LRVYLDPYMPMEKKYFIFILLFVFFFFFETVSDVLLFS